MKQGYIKIYRQLEENDVWLLDRFSRGQAWVDLILLANHKPGVISVRGNIVDIERGQVGWSIVRLAQRWGWHRETVKKFFSWLKNKEMIDFSVQQITTVVTIINYDLYQSDVQQSVQQNQQQNGNRTDTNKNDNNDNNEKNDNNITEQDFGDSQTKPPVRKSKRSQTYKPVDANFLLEMRKKFPGVDVEKFWEDVQTKQRLKGVEIKNERLTLFNWLTNDKKWSEERQHPQEKLYYADAKTRDGRIVKLKSNAPILPGAYFNGDDGMVIVS